MLKMPLVEFVRVALSRAGDARPKRTGEIISDESCRRDYAIHDDFSVKTLSREGAGFGLGAVTY